MLSGHLTPSAPANTAFLLFSAAFLLTGCPSPCEGAGCGALYPRGSLGLFPGESLSSSEVDALAPVHAVTAADADGYDWAVHGADGGLAVGVPAAAVVRWYDADAVTTGGAPTRTLASEAANDRFGAAVAVGPGATGGTRLLVGAPGRAAGTTRAGTGAVLLYEGVDASLAGAGAPRVVSGVDTESHLGEGVWACGDLDGDGEPDWAASAPWSATGASELAGRLVLGLSSTPLPPGDATIDDLPRLDGASSGAQFGAAVSCDASLDADPLPELVVAAPYADTIARDAAGTVSIWTGPLDASAAPLVTLAGAEAGASFGAALAVGDLDGDGLPEVVVGAPGVDGGTSGNDAAGAVYVYDGATLRDKLANPLEVPTPGADGGGVRVLRGEFARGRFGSALAIADLDGDGLGDLVVGAPGTNRTGEASATRAGAATVWHGPHGAWPAVQFMSDAPVTITADRQYLETGRLIATADLEADGAPELVLLTRVASDLE